MGKLIKCVLLVFILLTGYSCEALACEKFTNCKSCAGISQICTECYDGYWLYNSKICNRCPDNCELCSNDEKCLECKANFWDTGTCDQQCPEACDKSGCDDETGHCNGCLAGFYGTSCHQNCSLCIDGLCNISDAQCLNGCIDGYYMDTSNTIKTCLKCSENCTQCTGQANCTECGYGFYRFIYESSEGNQVVYCYPCTPPSCEECSTGDTCTFCKNGWSGQKCRTLCASQCHKCQQNDSEICTKCTADFFNSSCDIPCNENCAKASPGETCKLDDGFCLNGCIDRYWGDTCSNVCYEGCKFPGCNQTNGFCATCHRNYYGYSCEHECNVHCDNSNNTAHICEKTNGTCMFGCEEGYAGDMCEEAVTTQKSSVSTTLRTDEKTTAQPVETDQQIGVIIGAGAGGGVVIIAIVVIVIVCVVVRRKRRKDAESVGFSDVQDVQQQSQNDIDCLYAKPNKQTKEQSEDYVYAKPNKPVKKESQEYIYAMPNKPKNKKAEQTETHDNVVIDLDAAKETDEKSDDGHDGSDEVMEQETDVDEVLLENIDDDENKDVIVEDVVIPSSDTYYNMAGLVRSRVQVGKLLEHIKSKAEFETEFEKLPQGLTRTCNEAMKPHNRAKNRYNGIYAYDATRVVLQSNNFINANYVEGYIQSQVSYIASLGPTRSTMDKFTTFWDMVWQEKTNKIIMLTNLAEAEKMKCEQYWPDQGNENVYGDFVLRCTAEKIYSDFVVRELAVKKMSETRKVTQYHYTAWPDKTVPDNVASLVEFRDKVEQGSIPVTGPMVVHCSAGIGRTGTYIALDFLIREGKKEESVDVFGCVIALRGQRVNLVQNVQQYMFLHHCVLHALTCNADSLPVSTVQHMTNEKITAQYQALVEMQSLSKGDVRLSLKFQNQNRKEIRQGSDIPGDNYRVRLTLTKNDYINAVYVNGYKNEDKFIAAQTPLPNTLEDFVSMVYQESCPCVVCLDEENIDDKTVGEYLPPANKVSTFGQFQVECLSCDSGDDFTVRELKLSRIGSPASDELKVRHFQFKGWETSSSVPEHVQPFLKMIVDVEKTRHGQHTDDPIVVHCVTGAERSSLFCVVSILLEKCAAEKELSVLNTVCQVRSRRRSAIKDAEQLQFCYDCVKEIVENSDTNAYYNMNNM